MSSFDSVQAFYVLLFYSFFLFIVLLLWHFFWLKPYPMNLPSPEHLHLSNPNFETKIENLWDGLKYIYYIVFKRYDQSFWMHHCGFEAFCYIHFMRRMLLLVFAYFLITFGFGIPYSLAYSGDDIMNSFDLSDETYKVYIQIVFLCLFAFMFYYSLLKIKSEIIDAFALFHSRNKEQKNLELHTLQIRGFDKTVNLSQIESRMREIFELERYVNIYSILIPEISTLYQKEIKRKDLRIELALLQEDPSCFTNCFFSREKIAKKLDDLETEISEITSRDFDSNGSVFFVCDNQNFYNQILPDFSIINCSLFHPKKIYLELTDGLIIKPMPNPSDISWVNLNKTTQLSWLKSFLINFIGIMMILFLTTPASLLQVIDLEGLFESLIESADFLPGSFTSLLQKNLSPMIILLVSNILLLLIDNLAYLRKNVTLSSTQQSILTKCLIFLILNNFLVPALSLTGVESLFSLLSENLTVIDDLFQTFYLNDTGSAFILLLMEAGVFAFSFYLLRIGELANSNFNRKLVIEKRKSKDEVSNREVIFKNERILFQFGYFYANAIVYILIILVFSTTVPAISLSGLIYFLLKISVDGLELISNHRKEMDSDGKIIGRVIKGCCGVGIFFELLMMGYYAVSGLGYNICVLFVLLVLSCYASYRINSVEIVKWEQDQVEMHFEENEKKWKKSYKIPYF